MASMGDMLKLMQGGTDRTGFADMADQYAYTKPDRSAEERLALLKAAMEAGQGGEEGGEEIGDETGGFDFGGALDYIGEKGIDVKNFLEEKFGEYVPDSIANMSGEDIEKDEELTSAFGEMKRDGNKALNKVGTPKVASTGVPKTGGISMPTNYGTKLLSGFSKRTPLALGLSLVPEIAEAAGVELPSSEEVLTQGQRPMFKYEDDTENAIFDFDPSFGASSYIKNLLGMADGGRVGMQQGGAPGGMSMPALLGVSSGSSGNLFSNYMPNPSAVPGPNYGPPLGRPPMQGDPGYNPTPGPGYMQPMLMQDFDFGDYLGGPDPYAVTYDPYVDMGGSAYDQYGMGMTQEDIDKVFADTDKFSLAAQAAKKKAAEEAAEAAKRKRTGKGEGKAQRDKFVKDLAKKKANAKIGTLERNTDGSTGPAGGGKSCFVEGTPVEMADGTTKEITNIKVGDETRGGIVEVTMQCLPARIYNYKDVLVSGSHWVIEDNQFVAVEDSKHGVITDRIEPVYTLKTSKNRIWIYGIEFGDFETGSDEDWEPHFEAVRQKLNKQLDEKTH